MKFYERYISSRLVIQLALGLLINILILLIFTLPMLNNMAVGLSQTSQYQEQIKAAQNWKHTIKELHQQNESMSLIISNNSKGLQTFSSKFQFIKYFQALIKNTKVTIISIEPPAAQIKSTGTLVMNITGPYHDIARAIHHIEVGPYLVYIKKMTISKHPKTRSLGASILIELGED